MRPTPPRRGTGSARAGSNATRKGGAVATAAVAAALSPWRAPVASAASALSLSALSLNGSTASIASHQHQLLLARVAAPSGMRRVPSRMTAAAAAAAAGSNGPGDISASANRGGVAGPLRVPQSANASANYNSSGVVAAAAAASAAPVSSSPSSSSSSSSSSTVASSVSPSSAPSSSAPSSDSSPPDTLSTINTASSAAILRPVAADMEQMNANLRGIVGDRHPMLQAAAEQIFGAGGKRLRPAIVFLVARATAELEGLSDLTPKHRRLAEITEMIHTASLVHDDVLDECSTRRGCATVNSTYGSRLAVLVGDFLFAQSSWALANLENMEVIKLISQVIADFANGEISQAGALFDTSLTLQAYMDKSFYKTATLIAASARSAAVFSGCDEATKAAMFEYGRRLGLAFQVVDDVLDFSQTEEQLGKPRGQDLASGNLTAPVVFALQHAELGPELRELIEGEFPDGERDLARAVELVGRAGGLDAARALARSEADAARRALYPLPDGSEAKESLELMVEYVLDRLY